MFLGHLVSFWIVLDTFWIFFFFFIFFTISYVKSQIKKNGLKNGSKLALLEKYELGVQTSVMENAILVNILWKIWFKKNFSFLRYRTWHFSKTAFWIWFTVGGGGNYNRWVKVARKIFWLFLLENTFFLMKIHFAFRNRIGKIRTSLCSPPLW